MILFFVFDLQQLFTFDNLKEQKEILVKLYEENTFLTIFTYMTMYMVMAALSLPGAAIMTMAGGMLFGLWGGLAAALISSTIGGTLAFLMARFLFQDYLERFFADRLEKINNGLKADGALTDYEFKEFKRHYLKTIVMGN